MWFYFHLVYTVLIKNENELVLQGGLVYAGVGDQLNIIKSKDIEEQVGLFKSLPNIFDSMNIKIWRFFH